ncbi:MAG: DMT family transporter [Bacteroidia bacterium]|nr:DMT family transporter [Bacteroidia bacterium]
MQADVTSSAASRDTSKAVLALTLNAFVWGVSWWPLRELHSYGLHPLWATALVYAVVVTGLLTLRPAAWRGFVAHPQLWFLAAASGLTNVGFNWAVTVGDVVRVVLLFYLMPAWSVLVAWVMLGEKPSAASLLRLLLAMAGVLIVLKAPESPWPVPQGAADWLAIMGGFSFAVTNSVLRKYNHTPSESRMLAMFGGSGLMAAAAALVGMTQALVPGPALAAAGIPIVLGLSIAFMASNAGLQYGAARLAAGTTAIVMLTEILFASLSSAAMGAAELTPRVLLGGSLIVLAAVLAAVAPNAKSH